MGASGTSRVPDYACSTDETGHSFHEPRLCVAAARRVTRLELGQGIKILNVNGLGGASVGGADGAAGLPEQVLNSALRYRAQAPLIDSLLRESASIRAGWTT